MTGALYLAAALPDPPYLVISSGAVIGGLLGALRAWLSESDPDWGGAWVVGNIWGAGISSLFVLTLVALGVE